jgi:hypothetical protein
MTTAQLTLEIFSFGMLLWLGCYLPGRDVTSAKMWLAGLGLITYAVGLGLDILAVYAPGFALSQQLLRGQQFFSLFAAFMWLTAVVLLAPSRQALNRLFDRHRAGLLIILTTIVLYAAGMSLLTLSIELVPRLWLMFLIGLDMFCMGLVILRFEVADRGETWFPHLIRSLDYTFFTALLFGGQVVLVMVYAIGVDFPLLLLLLTTIAGSVLIHAFSDPVQTLVDHVAFFNAPRIRQTRSELRAASSAAQRVDTTLDLTAVDETEFTRLTRRALSHMGDLPKLAASPLTRLALVEARLQNNDNPAHTLDRAAELKMVLAESIERLKPLDKGEFGTTDEWRHYNALYFPYVVGIRPYSRRAIFEDGDEAVQQALDWFRGQVPERTLYNWQNAAAKLVAKDLREQSRRR